MNSIAAILFALANVFDKGNHAKILGYTVNRQAGGASSGPAEEEEVEEEEEEPHVEEEEYTPQTKITRESPRDVIIQAVCVQNFDPKRKQEEQKEKGQTEKGQKIIEHIIELADAKARVQTTRGPIVVHLFSTDLFLSILDQRTATGRLEILNNMAASYMDYMQGTTKILCVEKQLWFVQVGKRSHDVDTQGPYSYKTFTGIGREAKDLQIDIGAAANSRTLSDLSLKPSFFQITGRPPHVPFSTPEQIQEYLKTNPDSKARMNQAAKTGETLSVSLAFEDYVLQAHLDATGAKVVSGKVDNKTFAHNFGPDRQRGIVTSLAHPVSEVLLISGCDAWIIHVFGQGGLSKSLRQAVISTAREFVTISFHLRAGHMGASRENGIIADRFHLSATATFAGYTSQAALKTQFCKVLAGKLYPEDTVQQDRIMESIEQLADYMLGHDFALMTVNATVVLPPREPTQDELLATADVALDVWAPLDRRLGIKALPMEFLQQLQQLQQGQQLYNFTLQDFSPRDLYEPPEGIKRMTPNHDPPDTPYGQLPAVTGTLYTYRRHVDMATSNQTGHISVWGLLLSAYIHPRIDSMFWSRASGHEPTRHTIDTLAPLIMRLFLDKDPNPGYVVYIKRQLGLEGFPDETVIYQLSTELVNALSLDTGGDSRELLHDYFKSEFMRLTNESRQERIDWVGSIQEKVNEALEATKQYRGFSAPESAPQLSRQPSVFKPSFGVLPSFPRLPAPAPAPATSSSSSSSSSSNALGRFPLIPHTPIDGMLNPHMGIQLPFSSKPEANDAIKKLIKTLKQNEQDKDTLIEIYAIQEGSKASANVRGGSTADKISKGRHAYIAAKEHALLVYNKDKNTDSIKDLIDPIIRKRLPAATAAAVAASPAATAAANTQPVSKKRKADESNPTGKGKQRAPQAAYPAFQPAATQAASEYPENASEVAAMRPNGKGNRRAPQTASIKKRKKPNGLIGGPVSGTNNTENHNDNYSLDMVKALYLARRHKSN